MKNLKVSDKISAFDYDYDYDKYISSNSSFDLVIGTHSVSEFSYDIFKDYFTKVKINDIEKVFNKVISITSECENVTNCLYKMVMLFNL